MARVEEHGRKLGGCPFRAAEEDQIVRTRVVAHEIRPLERERVGRGELDRKGKRARLLRSMDREVDLCEQTEKSPLPVARDVGRPAPADLVIEDDDRSRDLTEELGGTLDNDRPRRRIAERQAEAEGDHIAGKSPANAT